MGLRRKKKEERRKKKEEEERRKKIKEEEEERRKKTFGWLKIMLARRLALLPVKDVLLEWLYFHMKDCLVLFLNL